MDSLFVYVTLRQGFPNEHILTEIGGHFEKASVKGKYIETGWGVEMGCPALQLSGQGQWINGQIFSSSALDNHWQFLDKFEGSEYKRVKTKVKLTSGKIKSAFTYVAVNTG